MEFFNETICLAWWDGGEVGITRNNYIIYPPERGDEEKKKELSTQNTQTEMWFPCEKPQPTSDCNK